jgi:hypothetical protein
MIYLILKLMCEVNLLVDPGEVTDDAQRIGFLDMQLKN